MEVFKKMTDIQGAIKFYSSIAKLSIIALVITIIGITAMFYKNTRQLTGTIYVLAPNGDVLQASQSSVRENRTIEAEAHTRLFITLFFDIDKFNYVQKINQSYDLGTTCIYNLHQKLVKDNWYTNMLQYNIVQTVIVDSIECLSITSPYQVNAKFKIHITSEASPDIQYGMEMNFTISEGKERSKNNPHALMIENIEVVNFSEL